MNRNIYYLGVLFLFFILLFGCVKLPDVKDKEADKKVSSDATEIAVEPNEDDTPPPLPNVEDETETTDAANDGPPPLPSE